MTSPLLYVVARVLIASVFIGLGAERLLMAAGVISGGPVSAGTVVFSAFELVAGLAIAFGWQVTWVSLIMAAFLVVDAFASHPFWAVEAAERHGQVLHFLKNLAAIGGLLLLAWVGDVTDRPRNGAQTPVAPVAPSSPAPR
ncbi:DoxX family protein [Rubrivirga sp.]|uniref:DoxX family protein n=1 Tax=Rubrivirga sp. TaxID=1885344 RepID=UPI003C774DCF